MKIESRLVMVDALRGYALMGLFLIHMVEYFELYWYQYEPHLVNTVMFSIFGGKAYAIFSMLFGLSFYIIMQRQADRGTDFRWRFIWRLVLLFGFGYVHGLMYGGDILQVLAVCGLILVPLWNVSSKIILALAIVLLAQVPVLGFVAYIAANPDFLYLNPIFSGLQKPVFEAYAHGSFAQVFMVNAWDGMVVKWAFAWESGRLWNIMGLSLVGFLLGRISFFIRRDQFQKYYVAGLIVAVLLAVLIKFSYPIIDLIPHPERAKGLLNGMITNYFNLMLTFASVLVFVLLYGFSLPQKILVHLAPAGRMSLTMYIGQSILFVPLFYGFGAGAYAYIGQVYSLLLGIALWLVQLYLARLWFNHFLMGPLEWCWRVATYRTTDVPLKGTAKW